MVHFRAVLFIWQIIARVNTVSRIASHLHEIVQEHLAAQRALLSWVFTPARESAGNSPAPHVLGNHVVPGNGDGGALWTCLRPPPAVPLRPHLSPDGTRRIARGVQGRPPSQTCARRAGHLNIINKPGLDSGGRETRRVHGGEALAGTLIRPQQGCRRLVWGLVTPSLPPAGSLLP